MTSEEDMTSYEDMTSDEDVGHTVGEVSRLAGVTVRTLHHYDEIGLLRPSGRSESGYRRYDAADVERLRQILCYRELGFALEEIRHIVEDPQTDVSAHMRRQRALLTKRIERLSALVAAIDREMEANRMHLNLTPQERLEVFGDLDPEQHEQEAGERWGATVAYTESRRRAGSCGKREWEAITRQSAEIERRMIDALNDGASPGDERATALAEEHRRHIDRWFYPCSHEMHRGLADMYVTDARFEARYEALAPGLARFVADAIHANADAAAGEA